MRAAGGRIGAGLLALLIPTLLGPALVLAHGSRTVGDVEIVVGFIGEPVSAGQRSGLELEVTRSGEPVTGLEATLLAEVRFGEARLELPLSPRSGDPGWYESAFTPTAAGQYAFRLSGTIDGLAIDETFVSGRDGFDDIAEVGAGQFPAVLPPIVEVAEDAKRGAGAADRLPIAFALGLVGAVSGLLALGVALARRRG